MVRFVLLSLLLGLPRVMKSSIKCSTNDTPKCWAIHWRTSAISIQLKILGAERKPKGRAMSNIQLISSQHTKKVPIMWVDT